MKTYTYTNGHTLSRAVLLASALFFTSAALAQPLQVSGRQPDGQLRATQSATQINSRFFDALQVYRQAGPRNGSALLELQRVAAERKQQLQTLIASDPAAVLAAAVPSDVRNALPAGLRDVIEKPVRLRGTMEVAIEDGPNYARTHYGLRVEGRRIELYFTDPPAMDVLTGNTAEVEGIQVGEALALAPGSMSMAGSVSILPSSFGQQKTLVILVNFKDEATQPVTPAYVSSLMFGASSSVSNWWQENSFQQTWATGDVAGWYTIPVSYTTCDTASIQSYGNAAAQNSGYVLSNYQHWVYIFPNNACSWWGYSTIGGSPTQSWIRDYNNATSGVALMNLTHELGHSLGLNHSHGWNCSAYPNSGCSSNEYGDTLDVMGNSSYVSSPHYNSFQKERLGWLNYSAQPPIQTVSSSGTYTLAPYESQDSGVKALKVPQSNGAYYYIEYRTAAGYDNFLSGNSNVLSGVVVRLATPGSANSSQLLNIPSPPSETLTPALDTGQSYTDAAGITITPVSIGSTAAVQVTLAGATCTRANPGIAMVSPSGSVLPGTTAKFNVTVSNKDSSACSASAFNLSSSVPSGWSAAYSAGSVTLSPGASTTVTLNSTAPSSTPNGTYSVSSITVSTSTTSLMASTSGTETIYTPPPTTVSVKTDATAYTTNQTVTVSVTVLSGGVPKSGAGVTVKITQSNATIASLTGTTGSNGVAIVTYRIKKPDPRGTWQVNAASGSGSATSSFTVQ